MWLYRKVGPTTWEVGHYTPDGTWEVESLHKIQYAAIQRVHFLNGGCSEDAITAAAMYVGG